MEDIDVNQIKMNGIKLNVKLDYCDIGFYYNQYEQKCMEDCSFNDTKS